MSVVLFGDVVMKSHQQFLSPAKILARFQEGDIIGFNNDSGQTLKIDNWCVARCLTIVAAFKYEDFEEIWRIIETKVSALSIQKVRN